MGEVDLDALETKVRTGDQNALAEFFHLLRPRLRRVVDTRLDARLRGRVDPSDVLQEAFLDLSQKLATYAQREKPLSMFVWMRLVAIERIIRIHRKHFGAEARTVRREVQRQPASATSMSLAEQFLAQFSSVENRLIRDEMRKALLAVLDSMDPVDREVITMRFFEELTNQEVAEALGISKNGASSRFVRAMTRLKKELSALPGFLD